MPFASSTLSSGANSSHSHMRTSCSGHFSRTAGSTFLWSIKDCANDGSVQALQQSLALYWNPLQTYQPPNRINPPSIRRIPRRALIKELQPRRRTPCKHRIARNLLFELCLQLRILRHHLPRQLFQHISLAVLSLLKDRIEESPLHCRI